MKTTIMRFMPVVLAWLIFGGYAIAEDQGRTWESDHAKKWEGGRVIRLYDGSARSRDSIAVIVSSHVEVRSPKYTVPGVAFVRKVDGKEINTNTEEIECLPGKHTVSINVLFKQYNVKAKRMETLDRWRYEKAVDLKPGVKYHVVFDPSKHEADIVEKQ